MPDEQPGAFIRGNGAIRAVYAVSFALSERTDPARCSTAPEAGSAAAGRRWRFGLPGARAPGIRALPAEGHTLEVEVFRSAEGRLWQGTWRHPHDDDLHFISDVDVGVTKNSNRPPRRLGRGVSMRASAFRGGGRPAPPPHDSPTSTARGPACFIQGAVGPSSGASICCDDGLRPADFV